jgi:hypothetical protein
VRPDIRPQLRELLEWYNDVLANIRAGALVEPGEEEHLEEEAALVARLLEVLEAREGWAPPGRG